jgi:hypothetical protein
MDTVIDFSGYSTLQVSFYLLCCGFWTLHNIEFVKQLHRNPAFSPSAFALGIKGAWELTWGLTLSPEMGLLIKGFYQFWLITTLYAFILLIYRKKLNILELPVLQNYPVFATVIHILFWYIFFVLFAQSGYDSSLGTHSLIMTWLIGNSRRVFRQMQKRTHEPFWAMGWLRIASVSTFSLYIFHYNPSNYLLWYLCVISIIQESALLFISWHKQYK